MPNKITVISKNIYNINVMVKKTHDESVIPSQVIERYK